MNYLVLRIKKYCYQFIMVVCYQLKTIRKTYHGYKIMYKFIYIYTMLPLFTDSYIMIIINVNKIVLKKYTIIISLFSMGY